MRILNLAIILIFLIINASSQELIIGLRTLNTEKTLHKYIFYDTLGQKLFSLPDAHVPVFKPILKRVRDQYDSFEQNNSPVLLVEEESIFYIKPNEPGLLVAPDKSVEEQLKFSPYLIDRAGNKLKEFPLFEFTSSFSDSIFIGYRSIENGYMLRYLDHLGNELFDGQEFWEASPFVDGLAVVQKTDENDDWLVIDKKGQTIVNISKTTGLKIDNVLEFYEGNAIIIESKSNKQLEEYYENSEEMDSDIDEGKMSDNDINWLSILVRGYSFDKNIYWFNIKGELKPFPNRRCLGTELYERQHNLLNKNYIISNEFKSKLAQSKYLGLIADSIITKDAGYFILWETPENSISSELVIYDQNGQKILLKGLEDGRILSVQDRMLIVNKDARIFNYDLENFQILEGNYFSNITKKNFRYYNAGFSQTGAYLQVFNKDGQLLPPKPELIYINHTENQPKKEKEVFAEFKNFPDPAFEKAIKELYPECFNSNGDINNHCKSIIDETSLVFEFKGIKSLDGIELFINLESLVISGNNIEKISKYPPKLEKLIIKSNREVIKELILPDSLSHLKIFESYVAETIDLPSQLKFLDISDGVKINDFPENLDSLNLYADLKTIPKLPNNLKFLDIQYINLTILHNLPNSIQTLYCSADKIVNLPSNLQELYCKTSKIHGLPMSLEKLSIKNGDDSDSYTEIVGQLPPNLTSLVVKVDFLKFDNVLPKSLKYLHFDDFRDHFELNEGLETFISRNSTITKLGHLPQSLKSLDLGNGLSMTVPKFPPILEYLNLDGFSIFEEFDLGILPTTLKYLNISGTNFRLPSILPENLTYLNCRGSKISALPKLSSRLDTLICSDNELLEIKNLPSSLKYLDCSSNDSLNSLSELPNSLEEFNVAECNIKTLPELPSNLKVLDCHRNQITKLPDLPTSLTRLDCSVNKLESLPSLSFGIKELNISWNSISTIESLPNTITNFNSENNTLTSFPNIPDSLMFLNINNNHLTVLPNFNSKVHSVLASNNALSTLPNLPESLQDINITFNCFDSIYLSKIKNKPKYTRSNVVPVDCNNVEKNTNLDNVTFFNFSFDPYHTLIDISNVPFGAKIEIMPMDKDFVLFSGIKYKNYFGLRLRPGEYRMYIDLKLHSLIVSRN